jgi:hypothetical protein
LSAEIRKGNCDEEQSEAVSEFTFQIPPEQSQPLFSGRDMLFSPVPRRMSISFARGSDAFRPSSGCGRCAEVEDRQSDLLDQKLEFS